MTEKEAQALREENERLKRENEELRHLRQPQAGSASTVLPMVERTDLGEEENFKTLLLKVLHSDRWSLEITPILLKIVADKPEIEVEVKRVVIQADGGSLRGWIARLIADGFFKSNVSGGSVQKELARRGYNANPGNFYKELQQIALMGFLMIEEGKDDQNRPRKEYRAVPGMKVHIVEK